MSRFLAESLREHARKLQYGERRVWEPTHVDTETGRRYFSSRLAEPTDWNRLYDEADKLLSGNIHGAVA